MHQIIQIKFFKKIKKTLDKVSIGHYNIINKSKGDRENEKIQFKQNNEKSLGTG